MSNTRHRFIVTLCLVCSLLIWVGTSCGRKESRSQEADEVLVQVGDSALKMSDVLRRIPHGLDPADSALMFNSLVDKWVSDLVLLEVAEKNIPDLGRIERMVEAYRNNLIVTEYLSSMAEQSKQAIPEEKIREYYDTHRDEFILQQPLVKGAYIRVDENDRQLENLRKWMAQFTDESFDNIEKTGLKHATAYDYFKNNWHEWSEVAEKIPYRFFDADAFVTSTKNFETTADGSVYILHISEYIPSGKEMPYEFAKNKINEILISTNAEAVRSNLKKDIYKHKIKEGFLRPGLYDPLKGEMKKDGNSDKKK